MSRAALPERIGAMLQLVETGGAAEIVRSYEVSGDFPAHEGIKVVFDFARNTEGKMVAHLSRITGGKMRVKKSWSLTAIQDRDSAGLIGFTDFAKSLGITGAQLANLIKGFNPPA